MRRSDDHAGAQVLESQAVRVAFDGVLALEDVTMALTRGEVLGMIGPNGAGKTTLINVLSGFVRPTQGKVYLDGRDITHLQVHRRPALGLGRTFQGVRLFGRLSVAENIEAAILGVGLRGKHAAGRKQAVLERMGLRDVADMPSGQLSYGLERRVGIARALALEPAFLLLDEPAAGMDHLETEELSQLLAGLRDDLNIGLLVIEHDMALVMGLCDRVQVLVEGRSIVIGTPEEVRAHAEVQRAYLGTEAKHVVTDR